MIYLHEMTLTEIGRKLVQELNRATAQRYERRHQLTAPCPIDGLPGGYTGTVGSGRVYLVYTCPKGDTFTYDPGSKLGHIIPEDRRNRIRLDQGATPNSGDAK